VGGVIVFNLCLGFDLLPFIKCQTCEQLRVWIVAKYSFFRSPTTRGQYYQLWTFSHAQTNTHTLCCKNMFTNIDNNGPRKNKIDSKQVLALAPAGERSRMLKMSKASG
jgi:hypothetical protein